MATDTISTTKMPVVQPTKQPDFRPLAGELRARSLNWTQSAVFARIWPTGKAIIAQQGDRTFAQLHDNSNRLSKALQAHGLRPGDALALLCGNRAEFVEVFLAAMRSGLRLTPINIHLTPSEAHYIVKDCGAKVLVLEQELDLIGVTPDGVKKIVIDCVASGESYDEWLCQAPDDEFESTEAGTLMLYTSGTTGRPKGVFRRTPEFIDPQFDGTFADYRPGDVALCCGPAYHSAPLLFDIRWPLASGVPVVMLEKWNSMEVLGLIERYRVTHAHMVPTMFQRLLALNPAQRLSHDLSSLRFLVHGAAPCPVSTKQKMIEWLGPVLTEYYAATEGGDGIHVSSQDWLRKPGTVGRIDNSLGHSVVDDDGRDLPAGRVGHIYFRAPEVGRFEYFGDPAKTAQAYAGGRFTLGDMGYLDEEGYLFLTGRAADCIISGGVNIYPREIDEVMLQHPAVSDVCTVGAPDDEWGERVVAVVILARDIEPSPELVANLLQHAGHHLASFKRPREVIFETTLPHTATGKLRRNVVRDRFWRDRATNI
jgi:long-chain acyl-CoA synthetase